MQTYPDPWRGDAKRLLEPDDLTPQVQMWARVHVGPVAVYLDRGPDVATPGQVAVECFACLARLSVPQP